MIKVENIDTWGFDHAIRGMRNPMNSWDKSDSNYGCNNKLCKTCSFKPDWCGMTQNYILGENDLSLMRRLYKAGTEHRKYLRQIFVSMDITAPLYWWKEMDQYRINVTTNSCSTMHKIAAKEFELDDFSCEHLSCGEYGNLELMQSIITCLNVARDWYLKSNDKDFWWQMIQLLPSSYNQRRTVTMNYENVVSIIKQRTGHKLDEWNDFVKILMGLPYIAEITE